MITFRLPPSLVLSSALLTALSPALSRAAGADIVAGELGTKLDGVASAAEKEGFHGVVLVAQNGVTLLHRGYGIANHQTKTRFAASTVVPIGSNVKDFTKVAILQLAEAGKLALGDPLSRFFPEAPADRRAVTVEQLMEHTSGLPIGIGPDDVTLERAEFLKRVFAVRLEFAPGQGEQYSNAGYSLLAAIVEKVTGQNFDAYVATAILEPLGLRETGVTRPRFDTARLARGYEGSDDIGTMLDRPHGPEGHNWHVRGNGGYLATLADQLAFFRGVRGDRLLQNSEHRDRILGLLGPAVLAGSDLTSMFMFASFPREKVEIVLASNHGDWKAGRLLPRLTSALGIAVGEVERQGPGGEEPSAPVALPDNGPGRTLAAYFEAFNSNDPTVVLRFFTERSVPDPRDPSTPPNDKRVANHGRMFRDLGRVTPIRVTETSEGYDVRVRGERNETATFQFQVEKAEPYRLLSLGVRIGG